MQTYAVIENDTVVNRIVANYAFMESLGVEFTSDPEAQIGCVRVNGEWVKPE